MTRHCGSPASARRARVPIGRPGCARPPRLRPASTAPSLAKRPAGGGGLGTPPPAHVCRRPGAPRRHAFRSGRHCRGGTLPLRGIHALLGHVVRPRIPLQRRWSPCPRKECRDAPCFVVGVQPAATAGPCVAIAAAPCLVVAGNVDAAAGRSACHAQALAQPQAGVCAKR